MTGDISNPNPINDDESSMEPPSPTNIGDHHHHQKKNIKKKKKNKKKEAFGILNVAVSIFRQRPTEKSTQKNPNPDRADNNSSSEPPNSVETISQFESLDDMTEPGSSENSTASNGTMSQHASALNLQELDKHEDGDGDEDADELFDGIPGDEMIDAKADVFIAQFYQEMKLQEANTTQHHHKGKNN